MEKEKIIKQKDLERIFKDNEKNKSDTRFIFLLGAGSSVQSGIPSAKTLAKEWIDEIKHDLDEDDYKNWTNKNNIDEENLANSYTIIYNKRFQHSPKNGYETLQKIMENIQPSIGYTILSQILENTNHNFVITTNFDSLIEDALFLFTSKRPLVCGHESLADFIQLNSTRPTIIKVHRDILLNPYNTPENTCSMNQPLEEALKPIIENSPIVIIGYGGNDESVMKLLRESKREAIYWCVRDISNISEEIISVLKEHDRVVQIDGFDELMVALYSKVYIDKEGFDSISTLSKDNPNESVIIQNAYKNFENYKKQLIKFQEEVSNSNSREFKENSKSILPNWWEYQIKINDEKDIEKKNELFLEGIKAHSESHELKGNYANFLMNIRNDYDNAEIYYKKVLEIDPNSTNYNGNYAIFLNDIRNDYDNAEIYYKKALELDPNHANNNGNYANFLKNIKKDYDNAEIYYKKALELDPNDAIDNANYASFLLCKNRKKESLTYLNNSFENLNEENALLLELWFYKLAHFKENYQEAKENLDDLLSKGYTSDHWDLSQNIERAIKDGHQNIDELKNYAKKISRIDYSNII